MEKRLDILKFDDQIYGSAGPSFGTNAEYICLPEEAAIAIKPKNISFGEAAAISEGVLTVLPFLRDNGKIREGQKILVNGASGGIGVYAVQLAKYFGAKVTGVCSIVNLEMVRSLGVDTVIDYTKEDFTKSGPIYNIIFDAVGLNSYSNCKKALTSGGVYLTTVPTMAVMLQMLWTSILGKKKAVFAATGLRKATDKKKDLNFLAELIEAEKIKPVIDRSYSLAQMAEAHEYVEKGHKRGSVVITI